MNNFKDQVRRQLRKGVPPDSAYQVAIELLCQGTEPLQAYHQVSAWMRKWAPAVDGRDAKRRFSSALVQQMEAWQAPSVHPVLPWLHGVFWYVSFEHHGTPADLRNMLTISFGPFGMCVERYSDAIPLVLQAETYELLGRLIERDCATPIGRAARAVCGTMAGCSLTRDSDGINRLRGLQLLEQHVTALETASRSDDIPPKERTAYAQHYAQALHNLAEARTNQPDATDADWSQALDEFRQVSHLPARAQDPVALGFTYQAIGTAARQVALRRPTDREALRDEAESAYDRALALYGRDPQRARARPATARHSKWNLRLERLADEVQAGRAPQAELARLANEALAWVKTAGLPQSDGVVNSVKRWQTWASPATGLNAVASLLSAAAGHGPITKEQAPSLADALRAVVDVGLSADTAMSICATVGRVVPKHVGLHLARHVWLTELVLLQHAWRRQPDPNHSATWWFRYTTTAFGRFCELLTDPEATLLERQTISGVMRLLAESALTEIGSTLSPLDRMYLFDLASGTTFRAESSLYGTGPTGRDSMEASWRRNALRNRADVDRYSFLVDAPKLMHEPQPGEPDLSKDLLAYFDAVVAEMSKSRVHMDDYGGAKLQAEPSDVRDVLRRERSELSGRLKEGASLGWLKGRQATDFDAEALKGWLLARPDVGVVALGMNCARLVTAYEGDVREVDLFAMLSDETRDQVTHARNAFVSGTEPNDGERLEEWLMAMKPLGSAMVQAASDSGLRTLVLRTLWPHDELPWGSIPIDDDATRLSQRFSVIGMASLLTPSKPPTSGAASDACWVFGGQPGQDATIDFGRAAAQTGDRVESAIDRQAFERALTECAVVRVFTHGLHNPVYARVSSLQLAATPDALDNAYTVEELLCVDARQCRRVELWACESGARRDFVLQRTAASEPMGWSAAFRLAGAQVVLSAMWHQPGWPAAVIAKLMRDANLVDDGGAATARALAAAVARYRKAVEPGGAVEAAALRALDADATTPVASLTLAAGWQAIFGTSSPPVGADVNISSCLGPVGPDVTRRIAAAARELQLTSIMEALRSPIAWAGWRVDVRGGDCL